MGDWKPIVGGREPAIVMCPQGGELQIYADGTVECVEGVHSWLFTLPPGVAICRDEDMPLAHADQWAKDQKEGKNAILS